MKKSLLIAGFSLLMLAGVAPPAHAGGRFFFGFGIGFGGGHYRAYRPYYPWGYSAYSYRHYPAYGWYGAYWSAPRVRYYVAPYYEPYRTYTVRAPHYRATTTVVRGRVYAPPARVVVNGYYGQYVPRQYIRR